jgi:hypothetical protein
MNTIIIAIYLIIAIIVIDLIIRVTNTINAISVYYNLRLLRNIGEKLYQSLIDGRTLKNISFDSPLKLHQHFIDGFEDKLVYAL